ncbi:MAG: ABC transporter permease [Melioribacteraceae bacterium]|nr:ABC transporter permease [Melioribacteraceae bacterium]MCF8354710.1 ABC transporter permease [Melioribacteraceae bacterium]MCF8393165.1 ABC transporter permease [Melioribacteraceae bacterium]MCF8418068.1 ABC transporter permease [Melioribacteraceae bacterium]
MKLSSALHNKDWLKPVFGVTIIFILCILFSPESSKGSIIFLKFDNLTNVLRQVSEIGIISIGMTFVIIAGGIDLSVGSVLALSATLTAFGIMDWQLGFTFTIILALFSGASTGFINGAVTAFGKMQSFIATLAMMTAARGFALFISDNNSRNIGFGENAAPDSFRIFTDSFAGIPLPVFIFVAVTIAFNILLQKTRFGRYVFAIGSNENASKLAGLKVNRIRIYTFVVAGLLSALAGIIHTAQLLQGNPNDGVGFELDAIAAVVIGGTSLMGGKGSISGTFAGVLIIGLLSNILGLHGIQKDFQLMLKGVIIIAAVFIQGNSMNYEWKKLFTKRS